MIPLNTRQGLPPAAFWYVALRSLLAAAVVLLFAWVAGLLPNAPHATCHGALCGKLSSGQVVVLAYLFAAFLVVRAVLGFKWFSYVLTDHSISVSSGILFRNTTTVRFDRIQDIDSTRNPLHLLLGLTSVAIWTASPDQRVGNARRPDAALVLQADDAEWLRNFVSESAPAVAGATRSAAGQMTLSSGRRGSSAGPALTLVVVALVVGGGLWLRQNTPAAVATAPAASDAVSVPANPRVVHTGNARNVHAHLVRSTAVAQTPTVFAIACALHSDGGGGGVRPCAQISEAQRCAHEADFPSQPTSDPAVLTVVNRSDQDVRFYWLDRSGKRALYATLAPGAHVEQQSHAGAHWLLSTPHDQCIAILDAATESVALF